ncbi:unnamed protein product [Polarella glacialis]|uniref:Uncharacterized protein n=1 Tax=Polarella glacialis TaxID=89957 RepID=A0A813I2F9_POLGL|nr:unnamed protein product [Polarella glacialis]
MLADLDQSTDSDSSDSSEERRSGRRCLGQRASGRILESSGHESPSSGSASSSSTAAVDRQPTPRLRQSSFESAHDDEFSFRRQASKSSRNSERSLAKAVVTPWVVPCKGSEKPVSPHKAKPPPGRPPPPGRTPPGRFQPHAKDTWLQLVSSFICFLPVLFCFVFVVVVVVVVFLSPSNNSSPSSGRLAAPLPQGTCPLSWARVLGRGLETWICLR